MASLIARYEEMLASGELRPDVTQRSAVESLATLQEKLEIVQKPGGLLRRLFGERETVSPGGAYMWGGVGRGKSMLMNLFHLTLDIPAKRRAHFHEFMIDVHERLREERKKERGDPIAPVAAQIAREARVLSFDEMVVNNSADAMIMSRLFTALLADGVTIVTTSNRAPSQLYKDGLNREHFLPFIALVEQRLEIIELDGETDYRLERIGGMDVWYDPVGPEATAKVRELFFRLTDFPPEDAQNVRGKELRVAGARNIFVPKSLKGVAAFSFKRLCAQPLGAGDYLAIARKYHSVFIVGIPIMGPDMRNEAARFVTLIDALYEHRVKLIATAEAGPDDLYPKGDGSFEFERTVSRLMEMQSAEYLAQGHGKQ